MAGQSQVLAEGLKPDKLISLLSPGLGFKPAPGCHIHPTSCLADPVLLPWEPEPEAEPEPGAPGPMPLSEPPPPGPGDVRSDQQAPEELAGRVRRLEGLLQELGSRLNALQLQVWETEAQSPPHPAWTASPMRVPG